MTGTEAASTSLSERGGNVQRSDSQPMVVMRDVTCRFGHVTAVDQVSLEVPPGQILGIIGPSGSGKTTVIRMLNGTLEPTSGVVRVLGENPRHFSRGTRERMGYMPQHFALYPELTASENLSFVASLFGLLWPRRRRRVREMLHLVELWDARNRRAKDLSGGMQRRLALACALVHEPILLFIDEPTAGLDPLLRQQVWEEFRRLREEGRTLLVTTQYVGEAEYCDRVALIAEGGLVALADPAELRQEALGGEMVEIRTRQPVDSNLVSGLPGVKVVRHRGRRTLVVVAENAATATPRLIETLLRHDIQVEYTRESRPSFDQVFAELVGRHQADHEEEKDGRRVA